MMEENERAATKSGARFFYWRILPGAFPPLQKSRRSFLACYKNSPSMENEKKEDSPV
jgi:hypothetical protein